VNRPVAVLLDAGYTLLRVRPSTGHHYAETGRLVAGFDADPSAYDRAFRRVMAASAGDLFAPAPVVDDAFEHDRWRRFTARLYREMGVPDHHERLWRRLETVFTDPRCWEPFPDTRPLLGELARRGVPAAVVSNWSTHLRPILEHHDLLESLAALVTSCEVGVEKPDPRIFALALDALQVDAAQAIHVGDSLPADVEAARAVGIRPLLIDRDGRHPEHPDRIESLLDILNIC
jgi:putative hydrolase of the HAD superfamily